MSSVPWSWPPPQPDSGGSTSDEIANDSVVAGATVTDALNTLNTTTVALNAYVSPYVAIPSAPDSFDDEFNDGDPDLSVRGFTVVNAAGVTLTRGGDIAPLDAIGPVGNTYWSTLVGSWIFIQALQQVNVYKTIVLAVGDTYWVRTSGCYVTDPIGPNRPNEVGVYAAAGAALDDNNRLFTTISETNAINYLTQDQGRFTGGAFVGQVGVPLFGSPDIRGVRYASAGNGRLYGIDSNANRVTSFAVAGAPAAATLTRMAVRQVFAGGTLPQIWAIDFIRKKTANAWLIP